MSKNDDVKKQAEEAMAEAKKTMEAMKNLKPQDIADKLLKKAKDFPVQAVAQKVMETLTQLGNDALETGKQIANAGKGPAPSRTMKYPYTFTAKIVQFPWIYYVNNCWIYKYYFISIVVVFPIFRSIHGVFNSPTNVANWEAIKQKERDEEHEH